MTKRPNFLFIITDQQRADWLGCYGHPIVKTPNIDAIAAKGTRFENFHVASPICMPNRASLLTGRMPSLHGLRYNGCKFPQNANTFVDVLAASGYHTAAIGKSHLQPFLHRKAIKLDDGKERLVQEAWKPDGEDYGQEQPDRYAGDGRYAFKTPYYGYQHVDMVTDHGDRTGGHYSQWFRENAEDWEALHDDANEIPHNYTCPQAYRTPVPVELYPTTWIADRTIDYLDQRKDEDDPFFAFVSFPDPHHPFNPPGKYWDMYSPDQFDLPLPPEAHKNPTPPMQWLEENYRANGGQLTPATAMRCSEQQLKEAMALTAGMITCVDDAIGRIMAALEESGQADNTIICFNSDHGDYLGDFGLLLKAVMPFRSITRVPFLWVDPTQETAPKTDAMASTIDLSATILDRVGLTPYRGMQGQSFLKSLDGETPHRDELFIEYNDGPARLGFETPARMRALRDEDWRITMYGGEDWGELYDLRNDPNETHNLWDSPDHQEIRAELLLRLNHHLIAQMDESPIAERMA